MATIHDLDRTLGLDLILHTPGGDMAATESIVDYLRKMFGTNMRAIIPHLAMSGGTMIACACGSLLMGKHSSIGPIDPQIGGIPAHGILEEFRRAAEEIKADPARIPIWQPILARYHPTLIGESEKAIELANEMVAQWLVTGMFAGSEERQAKAQRVVAELGDHALTKSHARHMSIEAAKGFGLEVHQLEDDQNLQDKVLSVHHACTQTLAATSAYKIIENHLGRAHIQLVQGN